MNNADARARDAPDHSRHRVLFKRNLPSADQIAQLPCAVDRFVHGDLVDANGHMNVMHYLDFGSSAADVLVRQVGVDDDHRADHRLGLFTAEHHLSY